MLIPCKIGTLANDFRPAWVKNAEMELILVARISRSISILPNKKLKQVRAMPP